MLQEGLFLINNSHTMIRCLSNCFLEEDVSITSLIHEVILYAKLFSILQVVSLRALQLHVRILTIS